MFLTNETDRYHFMINEDDWECIGEKGPGKKCHAQVSVYYICHSAEEGQKMYLSLPFSPALRTYFSGIYLCFAFHNEQQLKDRRSSVLSRHTKNSNYHFTSHPYLMTKRGPFFSQEAVFRLFWKFVAQI